MFDRFSDNAKKAMNLARQEAQRLGHEHLGSEHMLLGLVVLARSRTSPCVAGCVLEELGLDPDRIRAEIERRAGPASELASHQLPFTHGAKRALEGSMAEARLLGHRYIGTEHLLLGLIQEGEGLAAEVLLALGVEAGRARESVVNCLGRDEDPLPWSATSDTRLLQLFQRLTEVARRAMLLADEEARRFNQESIGTEHLLLGIAGEDRGGAAKVLGDLGLDLGTIRAEVEKVARIGPPLEVVGALPFTPHARKVLELSAQEARNLDHTRIGTEHLLFGLIEEGEGGAAHVLLGLGLRPGAVRDQVTEGGWTARDTRTEGVTPGLPYSEIVQRLGHLSREQRGAVRKLLDDLDRRDRERRR